MQRACKSKFRYFPDLENYRQNHFLANFLTWGCKKNNSVLKIYYYLIVVSVMQFASICVKRKKWLPFTSIDRVKIQYGIRACIWWNINLFRVEKNSVCNCELFSNAFKLLNHANLRLESNWLNKESRIRIISRNKFLTSFKIATWDKG